MKKIMTFVGAILFTAALSAGNLGFEKTIEELTLQCMGTVSVDCNGDGIPEYTGTTSCEFMAALAIQYQNSCP